jgi:hypothetical protein
VDPQPLGKLLRTGSLRTRLRWLIRIVTPWGVEWWLYLRAVRRSEVQGIRATSREVTSVEAAIGFLVDRGLDEHQVRAGSVPGDSLSYIDRVIGEQLPTDRSVRALHIGNFVGVSLCHFASLVRQRHAESRIVSIDPNLTHRGVEDPESHLMALLDHFGLLANNVIIRGYSLDMPPGASAEGGLACENVLESLRHVSAGQFDVAFLDGDHDGAYVRRELAVVRELLADDGIIVFDDIVDWEGVAQVFAAAVEDPEFELLGENGRVGILRLRSARPVVA